MADVVIGEVKRALALLSATSRGEVRAYEEVKGELHRLVDAFKAEYDDLIGGGKVPQAPLTVGADGYVIPDSLHADYENVKARLEDTIKAHEAPAEPVPAPEQA